MDPNFVNLGPGAIYIYVSLKKTFKQQRKHANKKRLCKYRLNQKIYLPFFRLIFEKSVLLSSVANHLNFINLESK